MKAFNILGIILSVLLLANGALAEPSSPEGDSMTREEMRAYMRLLLRENLSDDWKDKIKEKIAEKLNIESYDIQVTVGDSSSSDDAECIDLQELEALLEAKEITPEEYKELVNEALDQRLNGEC